MVFFYLEALLGVGFIKLLSKEIKLNNYLHTHSNK